MSSSVVQAVAATRVKWAEMTRAGLAVDRVVQVYDRHGRIVTARQFPRLLRLHATLGPDGVPLVHGLPWRSPEVAQRVEAAVAPEARLERFDGLKLCLNATVTRAGHVAGDSVTLVAGLLWGQIDDPPRGIGRQCGVCGTTTAVGDACGNSTLHGTARACRMSSNAHVIRGRKTHSEAGSCRAGPD